MAVNSGCLRPALRTPDPAVYSEPNKVAAYPPAAPDDTKGFDFKNMPVRSDLTFHGYGRVALGRSGSAEDGDAMESEMCDHCGGSGKEPAQEGLLPCPFCGSNAEYTETPISGEQQIECNGCHFISFWSVDWEKKQVFAAWNTRTRRDQFRDDLSRRAVDALRELCMLKRIKDTIGKTPEYERQQPIAWRVAFDVIQQIDNRKIMDEITSGRLDK
jgi:hypothetical protein